MRLLYAIDIRDKDLWHLDEVTQWATKVSGTVDLLYVNPFGDYSAYVLDPALARALDDGLDRARERDRKVLNEALESLPEVIRGKAIVASGDAPREIADRGADYDAVVLCTRGAQGLKRLWLGSVAERVLRLHHGPTIVLPANKD